MFIRQVKKQRSKSSRIFYQYSLVQAERIQGKVKQRVILYLGSDPLFRDKDSRDIVLAILKAKIFGQADLFPQDPPQQLVDLGLACYEKYRLRYEQIPEQAASVPPDPEKTDYQQVDLHGLNTQDVKTFGAEHLCSQVFDKLGLKAALSELGFSGEQARNALISIAGRAIYRASEHKTAQILATGSELSDLLGAVHPPDHKQLYAAADRLWDHKADIDRFIYRRLGDLFHFEDRLVIFDISNTYFETRKDSSRLAARGRSKERRNDCPLVVFTGVINAEGFIRHSRIYEGNTADETTLADMLSDLRRHAGSSTHQTIVIDAGIATEQNLELIRRQGYDYVCVSRKRLADYPPATSAEKTLRLTDRGKNRVALSVFAPAGQPDTWMYVQSQAKKIKETSMQDKLGRRFEAQLEDIRRALEKKGGTKKLEKVWERIGRAKEKYRSVSGRYEISVPSKAGKATDLKWRQKPDPISEDKTAGVYFIRTSYSDPDEGRLWDIYNTIRDVESTFRCLKTDLNLRPIHHQNDGRVQAHIYLTILAYQLVHTIRHMLKQSGLHYDWNNIVRLMNTQTIQTVELPTETKRIRIRKPSVPIAEVRQIYKATGCTETQKPVKKSVVYH